MIKAYFSYILFLLFALPVLRCGTHGGNPESRPALAINISYVLSDFARETVLNIQDVNLIQSDGTILTLNTQPIGEVSLEALSNNRVTNLFSSRSAPHGDYKGIEVVFADAGSVIYDWDDQQFGLNLVDESDGKASTDIDFAFDGSRNVILFLDVDLRRTIELDATTGTYLYSPSMTAVESRALIEIRGSVDSGQTACLYLPEDRKDDISSCPNAQAVSPIIDGEYKFLVSSDVTEYSIRIFEGHTQYYDLDESETPESSPIDDTDYTSGGTGAGTGAGSGTGSGTTGTGSGTGDDGSGGDPPILPDADKKILEARFESAFNNFALADLTNFVDDKRCHISDNLDAVHAEWLESNLDSIYAYTKNLSWTWDDGFSNSVCITSYTGGPNSNLELMFVPAPAPGAASMNLNLSYNGCLEYAETALANRILKSVMVAHGAEEAGLVIPEMISLIRNPPDKSCNVVNSESL